MPHQAMRHQALLYAIGLSLALGAADASAAEATRGAAIIQAAIIQPAGHDSSVIDLGPQSPPDSSDSSSPETTSAPDVNSAAAAPIPELPTWAMMLLCLAGLGLAGIKKGRKNRLSPGIE